MKISDIMTPSPVSIEQNEPVSAAAKLLKGRNIGSLPVCDASGSLLGIVTDRDIVLRCVAQGLDPNTARVRDIMSQGLVTAQSDDDLQTATNLMSYDQIRRIPVLNGEKLVGMLSLCDIARNSALEMEAADALCEISSNVKRR